MELVAQLLAMDVDRGVVYLACGKADIRIVTGVAIVVDDVATLVLMLEKHSIRPDAIFKSYHNHTTSEFSMEQCAAFCGSLNCIAELRKRGSRFKSKLYVEDDIVDMYGESRRLETFDPASGTVSYDDEDELDIMIADSFRSSMISPRMLAVAVFGHNSDTVRAIDGKPTRLRAGFDALYYRAFRRSFAPTGPAAKRARATYIEEIEGDSQ
tara:strand:- start:2766 stop:3398 length:633 start_codon:yes stop_codon:yes gene_type:complete